MMDAEQQLIWRLAEDLSVEDAAALIAGGTPEDTGILNGYSAALSGLKSAIRNRKLKATIRYPVYVYGGSYRTSSTTDEYLVSKENLLEILDPDDPFAETVKLKIGALQIQREPDWKATTVQVGDLREWLKSRGFTTGFFFSQSQNPEAFMEPTHDHFAPELALAVTVWRAMEGQQALKQSPKAAIEKWLNEHPEAWKGEGTLSSNDRERIATVVNWQRTGGAPTTA